MPPWGNETFTATASSSIEIVAIILLGFFIMGFIISELR